MNCPDDGRLRAKLDDEMSVPESQELDRHLAACGDCRLRMETLSKSAEGVRERLALLAPVPDQGRDDARFSWARFLARQRAEPQPTSVFARLFAARFRPVWAAAGVVVVLIASLSFAPGRSWAQRLLDMLRVQKIAVVPVDTQALEGVQGGSPSGKMIGQFLSDNIVVTMHSDQPQTVADASQASQLSGFRVRLLGDRTDAPKIGVLGEQGFQMTLNRERLQGLLDELGHNDLQLATSIDGALVAVHIPKSVTAVYGQCPQPKKDDSVPPLKPSDLAGCVILTQVPSPTVSVPPDLNLPQLATLALQASGMSAEDAQAFCATVDWTSTLLLPIPRDAGSYETTNVDGVEGTLITLRGYRQGMAGYSLLWVKGGIIYSLTGFGGAGQAVPLADSLQ